MPESTNIVGFVQPREIRGINWVGLRTFIYKETARFMNVYMQTIVAPLVTLFLFFIVFYLGLEAEDRLVLGVEYVRFLAPGLLMMAMVQNAFSNSVSSIVIAKVQGNIVDVLMPPLSPGEVLTGYIVSSVFRGLLIGVCGAVLLAAFIDLHISSFLILLSFAILGNLMLALLGVVGGLWSEKFDQMAALANFVITPLTFLSGTFYALAALPPVWQKIALLNPFFYMIDGFRAGFIGVAETNLVVGAGLLGILNLALAGLSLALLKSGYKTKS